MSDSSLRSFSSWFCGLLAVLVAGIALMGSVGAAVRQRTEAPALISRLATTSPLLAVAQAGKRWVVAGVLGHILWSDDEGMTWQQAQVPVSADLVALSFPSARIGYAVGHEGVVLKTEDGGAHWQLLLDGKRAAERLVQYYSQPRPAGSGAAVGGEQAWDDAQVESRRFAEEQGARPFLDVWFRNEKEGFIVGAWNLLLRTGDGGQTWEPWMDRADNPNAGHLYSIREAAGQVWISGEQGLLLRLDEATGRFVQILPPKGGSLFGVLGLGADVVAYGLVGRVEVSRDGGRSWNKDGSAGQTGITGGVSLVDGRLVLVDVGGGLWVSKDAGQSFERQAVQQPMAYFGVDALDANTLLLVGSAGVVRQKLP